MYWQSLLTAGNSEPEKKQNGKSIRKERPTIENMPISSPVSTFRIFLINLVNKSVKGRMMDKSAKRKETVNLTLFSEVNTLLNTKLPAAVPNNQLQKVIPMESSFPPKIIINSRINTICAVIEITPYCINIISIIFFI